MRPYRREFAYAGGGGSCHAPTLAVLPDGHVLAAWFEGSAEGRSDTAIRMARRGPAGWEPPVVVADVGPVAHWNPVLFLAPDGLLHLFFKVGARISEWQTWRTVSSDGGWTWSAPADLVPGDRGGRGPVKNKPIVLAGGGWLAPASREGRRWECFADASADGGRTWLASPPVPGDGVIQPTLWESSPGRVRMLMRSATGRIMRSDSADAGRTWTPAVATRLPSNNSGIDLARLADGTLVLASNPVGIPWGPRTPLVLDVSRDDGATWTRALVLEDEGAPPDHGGACAGDTGVTIDSRAEFSYPAVVALGTGLAVAYTWKRRRIAYVEAGGPPSE